MMGLCHAEGARNGFPAWWGTSLNLAWSCILYLGFFGRPVARANTGLSNRMHLKSVRCAANVLAVTLIYQYNDLTMAKP
jgi:hypothetical protein